MNSQPIQQELLSSVSHDAQTVDERIRIVQADSLIGTGISAGLSAIFAAAGLWGIIYSQTHQPGALVWAVLVHAHQCVMLFVNARYIRTPYAQRTPVRSATQHCNLLASTGVAWGLAPWLFLPTENFPLTTFMALILAAVASAGIASLAPYRRAIFSFPIPVLVGLSSALLWQGGIMYSFLGVCSLAYLYVSLRFGMQQNKLLTEALRTRYEKEDLAQRLAEQVQIAERASLEKTRFLASASHDLRQPLHSIGLFGAALLAKRKSTPDEPLVRNLMLCVDVLEASFTAMLDVSKLDAGVVQAKSQPVALAYLFQRLETSFGRQAESLGLALRFKPGRKWVYGDPILIERLLGNLVHNSLKFSQHGGVVLVARKRGQQLSVEVWDSGIGIDASELPYIFNEFYQLGNPERDRSKGLGMGLSIVQRLAKLMDMPLTVYSKVGRGTVFKLLMPLAEPQYEQLSSKPHDNINPAVSSLAGKRVLMVDDEESVRKSTAEVLRLYGIHVETADGIPQALEVAQRPGQILDMVITDLRLREGENGIDLVAELNVCLGRMLPALLITGDIAPERVQLVQQSGLRVLYKPVKIDDLLEALTELLASRNKTESALRAINGVRIQGS
jgi:signal transduction histidine kinase/ActR/RegA family two-component response regulator